MKRFNVKRAALVAIVLFALYRYLSSLRLPRHEPATELQTTKLNTARNLEAKSSWKDLGRGGDGSRLPNMATLRQQLAFQHQYLPEKPFPKHIWQTWKVGVGHPEFPDRYRRCSATWGEKNPTYFHHVIADAQCNELVETMYLGVPDVVEAWKAMPKSILKADFFRYLILFARGGVYSDVDTTGLKPIDTWASGLLEIDGESNTAGLVVGIEADPDRPDWADWYARRIQFCQWTIQAKVGHPMLRELIARITEITLTRKKKGQLKKILTKDEGGDIMNWTGPGIWTDAVFAYMNNAMGSSEEGDEQAITWKDFTGLQHAKLVADVLVLPITSFSPDVGQMGAKSSGDPMAYAKHLFLGLWKIDDPFKERNAREGEH